MEKCQNRGIKVLENAQKSDPLMYEDISMYEYKLKKFFCLCALGVNPTKKWIWIDEAVEGYTLVALENETLEFNINDWNSFEQNLLCFATFEVDNGGSVMKIFNENSGACVRIGLKLET